MYHFQVTGKVTLADGSPDNTYNIVVQPTSDQSVLEIASGVAAQLGALFAWISAYEPPSPPPPFSPAEVGGAVIEVVKVAVTVAGTVAEWDTPSRKLNKTHTHTRKEPGRARRTHRRTTRFLERTSTTTTRRSRI